MKYASYLRTTAPAPVASTAAPAWVQPDFIAGNLYTCKGPLDGSFKSKSFKDGVTYLAVKNGAQVYLVSETCTLIEVQNLKSKFVVAS